MKTNIPRTAIVLTIREKGRTHFNQLTVFEGKQIVYSQIYPASRMTKDEFLQMVTRDMRANQVATWETIEAEAVVWSKPYQIANLN